MNEDQLKYEHTRPQKPLDPWSLDKLRVVTAKLIESNTLVWRRHGIGVLQAYVQECTEIATEDSRETRIHVWSPELMLPGIAESGNAHNHRFALLSTILHGTLEHVEWCLKRNDESGTHELYDFVHARLHTKDTRANIEKVASGQRYDVKKVSWKFIPGASYLFSRGAYHNSNPLDEIVVSLVTKIDQVEERARVIAPTHIPPVAAFGGPELDSTVVDRILKKAVRELFRPTV